MTIASLPTRRYSLLLRSLLALTLLLGGGARLHAQSIAVMVNGEPITNLDIEQRIKLNTLTGAKNPDRQAILNDLIDEKVKIKEAKKYGVDPGASDIEQSYGGMAQRMRLSGDQLTKVLEGKGIRPDTLKQRIKADMVWTALVRGRFKESLQVGEKDVAAAAQQTGETTETNAFEYRMQPIVLIVPRGAPQSDFETRRKEADTLRERVTSCEEANSYFKSMRNAAIREIVVKTSADLPPPLRDMLDKTPIGHLTTPEVTKQGIEMVALCGRKETTVDTPKKREIRDKMFAEKYEAKAKSYLQEIRRAAMIEYPGAK
ncbi:SurA N- domain family protein [Bradyrhizobium sp. LTSPM299]|jgi:peptidyl-prolyl cis-trans isomerase SurA|uniref:SurA N-terminal domain-containing protein n=1 Tax=Bradyrhizobium sp. LTSPM299 TaxID=1619233 RepID=UPI0005C8428E|nr:SurA N-terminal domain-containing protein [Bradyrhizobium sp. LTSPM299]KJC59776.1 SurA N- domain family protein [Bradyrhizobium sp. LTSPM299]